MDSKTKHRILGILVVAGLIVLMLPLFQSDHEFTGNKASINPPPFPGQAVQTMATTESPIEPTPPRIINNSANSVPVTKPVSDSVPITKPTSDESVQATPSTSEPVLVTPPALVYQQPDEAIIQSHTGTKTPAMKAPEISNPATQPQSKLEPSTRPQASSPQQTAEAATLGKKEMSLKEMDEDVALLNKATPNATGNVNSTKHTVELIESAVKALSEQEPKSTKQKLVVNKVAAKQSVKQRRKSDLTASLQAPIDNDGLFKLKNAAYVVQLGSYNNKSKALQLVNKLRSKGYHAFIQQYSTNQGSTTDVFVGPEKKQTNARVLAAELEKEVSLHGTVVSYKPLAL